MKVGKTSRQRGISLVEMMVYIAVLAVIMGIGFSAVVRLWSVSRQMRVESDDLRAVLATGDRWREDIRGSGGRIVLKTEGDSHVLEVHPGTTNELQWAFFDGKVLRRTGTNAAWATQLTRIRSSSVRPEQRDDMPTWRWDLEFEPATARSRFHRTFSFVAVPQPNRP